MRTLCGLLFLILSSAGFTQRTFDVTIADSTYHMKQYWFVLYTKGDAAPLDSVTSARTLEAHLAHQDEQAARGLIQLAGPFGDDGDWRGILLYDCDTKEEVEGYLHADPFVRSSHLKFEVHPWWGAIGTELK
ncbi:MAG: YciI family protein [Flavobacteriales bacterium]